MHLIIIFGVVSLACLLRVSWLPGKGDWLERWQKALLLFLLHGVCSLIARSLLFVSTLD